MTDNCDIDNNNELIFWKVIHNKYLFKCIFNQIESNEWVEINDQSDYYIGNRFKFKKLTSLHWLIKNKQFPLLKCKLEAGEHIEIDDIGIQLLFKNINYGKEFKDQKEKSHFIFTQLLDNGYYRISDREDVIKRNELQLKNREIYINNLKEILILLIKYKRDQLVKFDILSSLFSKCESILEKYQINTDLIKLIVNEPYSLPITETALEHAIKNTTPSVIEILINSQTFKLSENFRSRSVSLAFGTRPNRFMVEYILSNSQLYSNDRKSNEIVKIKYSSAFIQIDIKIFEKLYKLNYLKDDIGTFKSLWQNNDQINEIKEILKHYSSDQSVYLKYLMEYDEIIDGLGFEPVFSYAIKKQCPKTLKYLLGKKFAKRNSLLAGTEILNIPTRNEFIKYYTIGYDQFKDGNIDEGILNYMRSIKSEIEFKEIYDNISLESSLKTKLPSKWFDIGKLETNGLSTITIKDTGTIDLIAENIDYLKFFFDRPRLDTILYFNNYQLFEYASSKYESICFKRISSVGSLEYFNTIAIYNYDIDQLNYLRNFNVNRISYNLKKLFINDGSSSNGIFQNEWGQIEPINFKIQTLSNLIELFDHLNSNGYKKFAGELFIQIIKCINSFDLTNNIENLKIGFNKFQQSITTLFLELINNCASSNLIQIISNNFNLFKDGSLIFKQWNIMEDDVGDNTFMVFSRFKGDIPIPKSTLFFRNVLCFDNYKNFTVYDKDDDNKFLIYYTSSESIQDIITIIKMLFVQLNNNISNSSGSDNDNGKLIKSTIQNMINHLFKRLIRVNGISFNQVNDIYQLISNEWLSITSESFEFQHTFYHTFYYLGIKSLKLIRFLLSLPSNKINFSDCDIGIRCYDIKFSNYDKKQFTIQKDKQCEGNVLRYIDPSIYTYEFIFGSSFQVLLEMLVQDLVYDPPFDNDFKYNQVYYSLLFYLLKIREFDLFFTNLEKIKQELKEKEITFKLPDHIVKSATILFNDQLFEKFNKI